MDYKKYYKEIKEKLIRFSTVVYYEPMTEDNILEMEKKIGQPIKPLYREYLLTFGMTQDIFEKLITDIDSFFEDFDFIKKSLNGYLPIFSDIDMEDTIYLINNKDLQDDFVYKVIIDSDDKIGKIKKLKLFQRIIEESISKLNKNHKSRCLNKNKVNNAEFNISDKDFNDFIEIFKTEGLKQKTDWQPKYYPENIFGDEVALFYLFDNEIIIERDEDHSQYRFELEEPILTDNKKSIIRKTEKLLKVQRVKFEKIECKLIENE
ncbi:hypothetical protein [Marinilabilia rubra]|uniref:Knr4/Smi1-like domain-containing protein n=1 Tax=Marinilabilia rubra TaxID=2162893 RepID=A0A2U2B3I3_9BACT|nr:hypothetical protein [Marinilabilia rubra]PWD97618.1 hypothetical protein DDZ16_19960 [Marinilabilia rubra]